MIGVILSLRLCLAVSSTYPDIPKEHACTAAWAITHEAEHWDPFFVAALVAPESGFNYLKVNPRSGACGLGQVLYSRNPARQKRLCHRNRVLRTARDSARAAIKKLNDAEEYCTELGGRRVARQRGMSSCIIAGYVGGPSGVTALGANEEWVRNKIKSRLKNTEKIRMNAIGSRPGPMSIFRVET